MSFNTKIILTKLGRNKKREQKKTSFWLKSKHFENVRQQQPTKPKYN